MEVAIVEQPELRIAGIRHIGPYAEIGREFGRLGGILKGRLSDHFGVMVPVLAARWGWASVSSPQERPRTCGSSAWRKAS